MSFIKSLFIKEEEELPKPKEKVQVVTPVKEVSDFSYLRTAFSNNKAKAGNISKIDFDQVTKTDEVVGDASYAIEFATGSSQIKPTSYKVLDRIFDQLTVADNLFVDIEGHTDNTGNEDGNNVLSAQRAESVLNYFLSKNPDFAKRLKSRGFGQSKPVADNSTEVGRAKNRRVEIKMIRGK